MKEFKNIALITEKLAFDTISDLVAQMQIEKHIITFVRIYGVDKKICHKFILRWLQRNETIGHFYFNIENKEEAEYLRNFSHGLTSHLIPLFNEAISRSRIVDVKNKDFEKGKIFSEKYACSQFKSTNPKAEGKLIKCCTLDLYRKLRYIGLQEMYNLSAAINPYNQYNLPKLFFLVGDEIDDNFTEEVVRFSNARRVVPISINMPNIMRDLYKGLDINFSWDGDRIEAINNVSNANLSSSEKKIHAVLELAKTCREEINNMNFDRRLVKSFDSYIEQLGKPSINEVIIISYMSLIRKMLSAESEIINDNFSSLIVMLNRLHDSVFEDEGSIFGKELKDKYSYLNEISDLPDIVKGAKEILLSNKSDTIIGSGAKKIIIEKLKELDDAKIPTKLEALQIGGIVQGLYEAVLNPPKAVAAATQWYKLYELFTKLYSYFVGIFKYI